VIDDWKNPAQRAAAGSDAGGAIANRIAAAARNLADRFSAAMKRSQQCRALAVLPDHLLRDIGLTRDQLMGRRSGESPDADGATALAGSPSAPAKVVPFGRCVRSRIKFLETFDQPPHDNSAAARASRGLDVGHSGDDCRPERRYHSGSMTIFP
jgi:uncharacterized protein YjiS (DUF1127 family)